MLKECVSGRVHIVLDHQRSVPYTCTIHSIHSCKSTLSGAVSTWRPRDPRRLCPAFRRGHKIGGADCGLAVRDQRNWKWRRGSTSVVSTSGGGRVLAAALEVEEMRRVRFANEGELLIAVAHRVLWTLGVAAVSTYFTEEVCSGLRCEANIHFPDS